jgi:indolepyruvate ferredoxin oxidoreductase
MLGKRKIRVGGWIQAAFRLLAPLKVLRGTPLDVFGYTAERQRERALRDGYFALIDEICAGLNADNKAVWLKLAQLPEQIRGYGHVKLAGMDKAGQEAQRLRAQLSAQARAA